MHRRGARNEGFFNNNQRGAGAGAAAGAASLDAMFKSARQSGQLNLSQKDLEEVPPAVYSLDSHGTEEEKFWEFNSLTNLLSSLSPELANLADLTSLKARSNRLTKMPTGLLSCHSLRHLDLADNQLSDPFFSDMHQHSPDHSAPLSLPALKECHLANNSLSSLPPFLLLCSTLRLLSLSDNRLNCLPDEIGLLTHLTHLTVKNNQLRQLPSSLSLLSSLLELDVSRNQLASLPSLAGLSALQLLDAGQNKITQLPDLPTQSLRRLHLEFNQLTSIPDAVFSSLQSLFELHVHDNQLSSLSPLIGTLVELKVLDISNNDLSDLPPALGYMATLQRLLLDGNPIRTIRRALLTQSTVELKKYLCTRGPPVCVVESGGSSSSGDRGRGGNRDRNSNADEYNEYGWAKDDGGSSSGEGGIPLPLLQRLRNMEGSTLDLSHLHLTNMPPTWPSELQRSHSLESTDTSIAVSCINFSDNLLEQIPPELFSSLFSGSLRELVLTSNNFGGKARSGRHHPLVPPCIIRLNLSKNKLSTSEVSELLDVGKERQFSLQNLLLQHNIIDKVPFSLVQHSELREVQLSCNRITTLNSLDFSLLSRLSILDVSNNKITNLGNVHQARALQTLLLENNDLRHVPPELALLEQLQTLTLFGNPQKTIRQTLVHKGADAILQALKSKLDSTSMPISPSYTDTSPRECEERHLQPPQQQQQQHHHQRPQPSFQQQQQQHLQQTLPNAPSVTATGCVDEAAVLRLQQQVSSLEQQLDHPSVSQAKRFALKKEVAKARANIIRLKRQKQQPK